MIHRFQHRVGIFLEPIMIDLFFVDLILGWSVDEHFGVKVDSEGYIEEMTRLLDQPFDAVGMLVGMAITADFTPNGHIDEYFEEVETIVEVLTFGGPEIELRNDLVAIGVKHSEMI